MDGFAVAIYAICVPNFRVVYLQFYRASSFRSTFNYSFIYISWPEKEIEMEEKENKIYKEALTHRLLSNASKCLCQ